LQIRRVVVVIPCHHPLLSLEAQRHDILRLGLEEQSRPCTQGTTAGFHSTAAVVNTGDTPTQSRNVIDDQLNRMGIGDAMLMHAGDQRSPQLMKRPWRDLS